PAYAALPLARRRFRVSGRELASPRRSARRAQRPPAALGLHQLPAESRSGGQPRPRRTAVAARATRGAARSGRGDAARPISADALHGRGVGRARALPLLL